MKNFIIALIVGTSLGVYAQQPVNLTVPSGTIMYFDLTTVAGCPVTWTEYTTGRGRYIIGLNNAGTKATGVGTALTDQENRTHTHTFPHTHTMAHTHTIAGTTSSIAGGAPAENGATSVSDDHSHTFSSTSSASSAANTGSESTPNTGTQSVTVAPYMQYLLCSKN